ncbi:MAG: metal-dependent transcriptional regulator [Anaerolineaceae bacterium]|nr:metal-dependent transcriptional regulator [Anaerolineaceae bacterium]
MSEKISTTIEDYLGIIFLLERDGEPVVGAHLAELLGVTPPTVTNTLKRMIRDGLIMMDSEHGTHLTEYGKIAAGSVMRKHMLAEWMLTRMVSWSNLHKEAHQFEHAISNEVEAALLEELQNPKVCPHGNPLPGYENVVSDWIPITQTTAGQRGIVRRIHELAEENHQILSFLEEKKIAPQQEVVIKEVLSFNQTVLVEVGGKFISLGFAVAQHIYIELVSDAGLS